MAQNTELQERYSKIVEAKLRATSIFNGLFNHRHEGDPKAGAVKIPVRAEATTGEYDVATGMAITAPTTSYITLVLDNDYAVNELIDGYVADAVPDGLVADRLDSAGYALANNIDAKLVSALETEGTAASTTKADAVKAIIETVAEAKTAKVDPNKMWITVSPKTFAAILTSDQFIAMGNTQDLETGLVGKLAGIPVYESANMSKEFIVGNSDFCHMVNEFNVPVHVADLDGSAQYVGASAVKGRMIYGYKISKPETVFVK